MEGYSHRPTTSWAFFLLLRFDQVAEFELVVDLPLFAPRKRREDRPR
jgi:hypothetical protein